MKSTSIVIFAVLVGSTSAWDILAALHSGQAKQKAAKDAKAAKGGDPMAIFSQLMQKSAMTLEKAQKQHKRVVKQVRMKLEQAISTHVEKVGEELGRYAEDLNNATEELAQAVNVSKAVLAKAAAVPDKPGSWGSPEEMERASLTAKIGAADQDLRRANLRKGREVHEAAERSESALEDETTKLGRKLGDLTPVLDKANAVLEAKADVPAVNGTAAAPTALVNSTGVAQLKAAEKLLAAASSKSRTDLAGSTKKFNLFLDQTSKSFVVDVKKIADGLQATVKTELKR